MDYIDIKYALAKKGYTLTRVAEELGLYGPQSVQQVLTRKYWSARVEADVVSWIRDRVKADVDFHRQIDDLPEEVQETIIANRADAKAASAAQAETLVRIGTLKQLSAEGKLEAVYEWIENFIDSGEKLVVFAWHTNIVKRVAEKFGADIIIGETPIDKRQRAIDLFQSDQARKLLVMNMQAGGTGIDGLQKVCCNVAFIELGWNPGVHDQAEDRLDRMGQEETVNAWYFIGENSIDEWIYDLIEEKRVVVDATTDGVVREKRSAGMLKDLVKRLTKKGEEPGTKAKLNQDTSGFLEASP
jgi:SNF2 family DNA or RNA helicase